MPERCVHIGDRESDIYELFCLADEVGTHFLVRTCVDRLAGDGKHTIADEMSEKRLSRDCTASKSATERAISPRPCLTSATAASWCCRRSASRNNILA